MFTRLDDILFPNRVEVYDFSEINKFFYPIFKCGSSTLRDIAKDRGFKTLINEQIKDLDTIDVFIRNPKERFISGVQGYLFWLEDENPDINIDTVLYYIRQGIILDRHFAHQFQWIINLARYMNPSAKIHFHSMAMMNEYCRNIKVPMPKLNIDLQGLEKSPVYAYGMQLDQLILDELVGQSWTVNQIMTHLMTRDPTAYFSVIGRTQHIAEVAHVLPKV